MDIIEIKQKIYDKYPTHYKLTELQLLKRLNKQNTDQKPNSKKDQVNFSDLINKSNLNGPLKKILLASLKDLKNNIKENIKEPNNKDLTKDLDEDDDDIIEELEISEENDETSVIINEVNIVENVSEPESEEFSDMSDNGIEDDFSD